MEEGSFKGYLCDYTKGILSLCEASFLWLEGGKYLRGSKRILKETSPRIYQPEYRSKSFYHSEPCLGASTTLEDIKGGSEVVH